MNKTSPFFDAQTKKPKPLLYALYALAIIIGLAALNVRQSLQRADLIEAALSAADELTGLIGTGSTIDQLLDAAEKNGNHQLFRTHALRCQHIGWEKGAHAARPACEKLLKIAHAFDEHVRARIELALVLKRSGNAQEAQALLQNEVADSPRLQTKLHLARAEILFAQNDDASALKEAKTVFELSQDPSTRANALMYGGLAAAHRGETSQAERWLQQAVDIRTRQHNDSPEYDEYTINLARTLKALGTLPGHWEDARKAEALIAPLRAREPTRAELALDF